MKKKGFTLIELVVVVIIIGILAAIALPAYNRLVEKSRKAEAFATLKAILDSQKRHALEFGTYADVFDDLDINVTDPGKYFDFRLRTNPDPNNSNIDENMAVATRLEPWDAYRIRIHETGRFYEWVP